MGQESSDLWLSHISRVAFVVKDDEAFNPLDVSLLGSDAVMFEADDLADLIKEFGHGRIRM